MQRLSIHLPFWREISVGILCLMTFLSSNGCIAIQNKPSHVPVSYCEEPCPLYDRAEVAKMWAGRVHPARLTPAPIGRMKAKMSDWIRRKKEEANPPPWPRFHPVPTRPVFEPTDETEPMDPEMYGQFGPNQ